MSPKKHILIVDDDEEMGDTLKDTLSLEGYKVHWVGNGMDGLQYLLKNDVDVVFLDLLLPGIDGIDALKKIKDTYPAIIVIMISGHGTIQTAIQATQIGAYDWLEKPLEKERVLITLRNAIEKSTLIEDRKVLLSEVKKRYRMVGVSPAMQRVFQLIDKVAPQQTTVLITGESGTGKELVARAIHLNSHRSTKPFIHVNCAAIPETLIESELFGHKKGAFTGATSDMPGKFQMADQGTLFLDEIGDLSQNAQAKILRALESGEVETVGLHETTNVDVRLLAATNRDLQKLTSEGSFREDLYHRINVIEIFIPPLRERLDDIIPLVQYFSEMLNGMSGMKSKKLTSSAEAALLSYKWPGNVRELRNLVEKMDVIIDGDMIYGSQIYELLEKTVLTGIPDDSKTYKEAKKNFEKGFLLHTLQEHGWNVTKAAKAIDMPRSLLHKKMNAYGLKK